MGGRNKDKLTEEGWNDKGNAGSIWRGEKKIEETEKKI